MSTIRRTLVWFGQSPERENDLAAVRLDDVFEERGPTLSDVTIPEHVFAATKPKTRARARLDEDLPEEGSIIEKYRLDQLVGVGGFAGVYRATHLLLDVVVAVKLLRPALTRENPGFARKLVDEARAAARISDPNVVRVHDVTSTPQVSFIVMEYIEAGSLSQELRRVRRLPTREVLRVAISVAKGLRAAAKLGITHRDIKPGNILLTGDERVAQVGDLGLARLSTDATATGGRGIVGTPPYMAPEQVVNATAVDHRADIFSLGVTMYLALTGELPFPPVPSDQLHLQHQGTPIAISALAPDVPISVSAIIAKMMDLDRAKRPSTYDELLGQLNGALDALPK